MTERSRLYRKQPTQEEPSQLHAPQPANATDAARSSTPPSPGLGHDFSQVRVSAPAPEQSTLAPDATPPVSISQVAPLSIQGGWLGDAFAAIGGAIDTAVSAIGSVFGGSTGTPSTAPTTQTWPQIITIGSEKVEVTNEDEKKDAPRIIKDVKDKYGIEISSLSGVEAIKKDYDKVPEGVRNGLQTKEWKYKELKALERALSHFAPILGKKREQSKRAGTDQEVTTASKVKQAIDTNKSTGVLDTTTLGEYFKSSKNFSMFEAGEDSTIDFAGDNPKQLEATAIHEIAHGLLSYATADYVKALDYWTDERTASGKSGAEAPITDYGAKNAREDLSEAVMFFFLEPKTLKDGRGKPAGQPGNPCPKRYEFLENLVSKWAPPVGDFPMSDPNSDTAMA